MLRQDKKWNLETKNILTWFSAIHLWPESWMADDASSALILLLKNRRYRRYVICLLYIYKKKQGQTHGRGLTDPNSLDLFLFGPDN